MSLPKWFWTTVQNSIWNTIDDFTLIQFHQTYFQLQIRIFQIFLFFYLDLLLVFTLVFLRAFRITFFSEPFELYIVLSSEPFKLYIVLSSESFELYSAKLRAFRVIPLYHSFKEILGLFS